MNKYAFLVCGMVAGLVNAQQHPPHLPQRSAPRDRAVMSDVDAPPEIVAPSPRAEDDQERAHGMTLFGNGLLLFHNEKYSDALAAFERAWQWEPATSVLNEIVPLAFELERQEAIAYAALESERNPKNPSMMGQLAMAVVAQSGDFDRGLGILDKAITLQSNIVDLASPSADSSRTDQALLLELHVDRLQLSMLDEQFQRSIESADFLRNVLLNADDTQLDQSTIDELINDKAELSLVVLEAYLQADRWRDAKDMVANISEIQSDPAIKAYYAARIAEARDEPQQAIKELKKYFESKSTKAEDGPYLLLERLAVAKYGKDDYMEKLSPQIERLVDRDSSNMPLTKFAGHVFAQSGQAKQARPLLELQLGEASATESRELLQDLLVCYSQLGLPGPLIALFGQAYESNHSVRVFGEPLSKFVADKTLYSDFLETAKARKDVKRRPMVHHEAMGVALVCLAAEDVDNAELFAQWALDKSPDAERESIRMDWAEACYLADHYTQAVDALTNILANPSDDVNIEATTELIAMCLALSDQNDKSLKVLDDYLAQHPESVEIAFRRAWVLFNADQQEQAIQAYTRIVNDHADDYSDDAVRDIVRDTRMILSNYQLEHDRLDDAAEQLQLVLDEYPDDVGAMNDLGYLWCDAGMHLPRALRMIQQAVDADPENPAYLDSLGWVHYRMGNLEAALEPIQQAVDLLDPADAIILDHLADVLLAIGRSAEAHATWDLALASLAAKEDTDDNDAELKKKIQSKLDGQQ